MFYPTFAGRASEKAPSAGLAGRAILLGIRLSIAGGWWALGAALALAAACGGGQGMPRARGGTGGSGGPPGQPVLPQVVNLGGPVLTTPKVQPIIYASDAGGGDIMAFLGELASTSYWGQATAEYGVGALTVLPPITLTTPAPATISDDMLESSLAANTSGANPGWGPPDAGTIYLFVLPAGTIEQDSEGACCTDYDGYHYETTAGAGAGAVDVAYAVSCACSGFDGPDVTDLQERTVDMSHELVESATDPFPDSDPAFTQEDDADIVWTFVTDGEVADMCEFNDDANVVPPGSTYMVQRSWSNAAARAFQNPCVPVVTTTPYLNSFPRLSSIPYDDGAGTIVTQGVDVRLGASQTIDVDLMSAAGVTGPWTVQIYDYDAAIAGLTAGAVLRPDASSGSAGDTIHLTITPKTPDTTLGGEAFIIDSDYGNPGDPGFESQLTMGLVTNN